MLYGHLDVGKVSWSKIFYSINTKGKRIGTATNNESKKRMNDKTKSRQIFNTSVHRQRSDPYLYQGARKIMKFEA